MKVGVYCWAVVVCTAVTVFGTNLDHCCPLLTADNSNYVHCITSEAHKLVQENDTEFAYIQTSGQKVGCKQNMTKQVSASAGLYCITAGPEFQHSSHSCVRLAKNYYDVQ